MARPKPSYIPVPRVFDAFQVATRLNKSENWFGEHRMELEGQGFPKRDEFLGGWDADAIERWLDMRAGLVFEVADAERQIMEAIG